MVAVPLLLVVSCSIFWPTLLSHYALTSSSRKDVIRKFLFEEAETLKPGQLVFWFCLVFFLVFFLVFKLCVCVFDKYPMSQITRLVTAVSWFKRHVRGVGFFNQ